MKINIKNMKKKTSKYYLAFAMMLLSALMLLTVFSTDAYALEEKTSPKLVSGTLSLLTDASTWLLGLIPAGAGLFLGYQAWQKSMTEDEGVIASKNKLMRNVLIGSAFAETASGLATVVLSYYK